MTAKSIYRLLCVVLVAVIALCLWQIEGILRGYWGAEQTYTRMASLYRPATAETAAAGTGRDFAALQAVNHQTVAWITIPGTAVDYPVVQGSDNRYYLNHLITGEENRSGSIFLDCRVAPDLSGAYNILYGHNMLDGTMFSDLTGYGAQAYYDQHPAAVVETPAQRLELAFFAGFVADPQDPLWAGEVQQQDFAAWLDQVQQRSAFASTVIPREGERILALVTCSDASGADRFVLLGVLRPADDLP